MRSFHALVLGVIVALGLGALAGASRAADLPTPLVNLDAASLSAGPVASWKNLGTAGGEFTATPEATPQASQDSGRNAVTFSDGHFLTSSIPTPEALTGGKPFTLAVWARAAQKVKRDVMVSWAARPIGTAEFGYGAGPDGAFFGWDKAARFGKVPEAGRWHHIAYSYATGNLTIYVDGLLDAKRGLAISPKAGGHIYLGAGWNAVDHQPVFAFHGSLASVEIWDRALTQREIRNAAGWMEPFNPAPADGDTVAAENAGLSWETGSADAKSFAIRLATSGAAIESAAPQHLDGPKLLHPDLTPGGSYFWRVDQLDATGKTIVSGPIWHFTTDDGPAIKPMPRDRVAGVPHTTGSLTWTPGRYADAQRIFFGTDANAIAAGTGAQGVEMDAKANACPIPGGPLEYGKTYYWRVEEENGKLPASAGRVWAFRTEDAPIKNDVTFFVGSDCHYGLGNNDELNRMVIDQMNWLPGTVLPAKLGGGIVRTPRGVVLDGDLIDKGFEMKTAPANWAEFTADYGLTGEGRLGFPVFEGFGNHDGPTGKSVTRDGIKERNQHRPGITSLSANGLHYSWDWDQVHAVQLNLFPGHDSSDCIVGPPNHNPEGSLDFLKEDLAKNVGSSGRIVVIFCHYCYSGGMADWWTDAAKSRFYQVIKPYRAILIHGHSHGAYFYTWNGIQAISDGATARPEGQTGDFMVVRITPDELLVAQRKIGEWGITLKAALPAVRSQP